MYGDIRRPWAFNEGTVDPLGESCDWGLTSLPQNSCRNVAAPADGDHEIGFKVIEYAVRECLTELVNLSGLLNALLGSGAVAAWGLATYLVVRNVHFLHHLSQEASRARYYLSSNSTSQGFILILGGKDKTCALA